MSDLLKLIGENVKKYRELKNYSQGDLAKELNFDNSYVSAIENGRRNISIKILEKFAKSLDVKIDKFFNEKIINNYNWILLTKERDTALFPFYLYARGLGLDTYKVIGKNLNPIACTFSSNGVEYYVDQNNYLELGKIIWKKLQNKDFYKKHSNKLRYFIKQTETKVAEIKLLNLSISTNEELFKLINDLAKIVNDFNAWGQIVAILEYGPMNLLTADTNDILKTQALKYKLKTNLTEDYYLLSSISETTYLRESKIGLLNIAKFIFDKKPNLIDKLRNLTTNNLLQNLRKTHTSFPATCLPE